MSTPVNYLATVTTRQESKLAYLQNINCAVRTFNTRFQDFERIQGNLGSSVNISLPTRLVASDGLVAKFQGITQRQFSLTVDQGKNVSIIYDNLQKIFNLKEEDYMRELGKASVRTLSDAIEINILKNATSSVPVMTQDSEGEPIPTGQYRTNSGPYRFYGSYSGGVVSAIDSYEKLDEMLCQFREFGSVASGEFDMYMPLRAKSRIIGSGLSQFVWKRNEEIAKTWEVGEFGGAEFYISNLLPLHRSGSVGTAGSQLTVVSTVTNSNGAIERIIFSGASNNDANAIKRGDMFQFVDGVSGKDNVRFLTYTSQAETSLVCQFRSTADSASNGSGQVTVDIFPALQPSSVITGDDININVQIVAGMKCTVAPSHRAGLLIAGKAGFLAMPQLQDQRPFDTSTTQDDMSGASIRMTSGALFGRGKFGEITDSIWGSHVCPDYCMRVLFPATI